MRIREWKRIKERANEKWGKYVIDVSFHVVELSGEWGDQRNKRIEKI